MPVVGDEFVVSTAIEWSAISSPVRFEIMEFMRMVAPCSLSELGAAMARPADGLYHHFRVLHKAGLLIRCEDRMVKGRPEAVFDLPKRVWRFDVDPPSGRNIRHVKKLTSALARMTNRSLVRAIDARLPLGQGDSKQIWARAETGWLDEAAQAEVNKHLVAIEEIFDRGRQASKGRLFCLSFFMTPVVRQSRKSSAKTGSRPVSKAKSRAGKPWSVPTAQ